MLSSLRAEQLRATAHAFCHALVAGVSSTDVLDGFFRPDAVILEYGPQSEELPFLGRAFRGRRGLNPGPPQPGKQNAKSLTCDGY